MILCSCSTMEYYSCPVYPVGGPKVGAELSTLDGAKYAHTFEWIGRIDKLRQELELCK